LFFITQRLKKEAHTIKTPLCIVHSVSDMVVPEAATEVFLERLSCEDVKFEKKDGWFHEVSRSHMSIYVYIYTDIAESLVGVLRLSFVYYSCE
jgi:alpha-beta hydrolase superfamily lysophospholipase